MEKTQLKGLLESLIFVAESPIKVSEIHLAIQAFELEEAQGMAAGEENPERAVHEQLENYALAEEGRTGRAEVQEALEELKQEYKQNPARGILLVEVANGWQFRTRPEYAGVIRQFYQPRPAKFSKPGLETLSIIAYRQPVTRVEIDEIRGVDSGGVLKTLLEKNLVRIVGKKDEPGKPLLYGTTQDFLELFNLKSLKELPSLKDFRELEEEFNRKSGTEGVIVENTEEEGPEKSLADLAASADQELAYLDEEEEGVLMDLDAHIKDVRQVEREVFPSEKNEESQESASDHNSKEDNSV